VTAETETPPGRSSRARGAILPAVVDIAFVLIFAAIGRASHGEDVAPAGLWQTAWPFFAGLALAWLLALAWRRPTAVLRSGLPVWAGTVVLGLVIRVLFTDSTAALPFIIVASAVLGALLVGWRAVWAALRALTARTHRVQG